MLTRIIVASREDMKHFTAEKPYAVISFVGHRRHRTPLRLGADRLRMGRIVIRADDTYPGIPDTVALSEAQAQRIAAFVRILAGKIDTLVIHCHFGHGRSCAAAIAIARAFGLRWDGFLDDERVGNGHVTQLVAEALEQIGYRCGTDPASYDQLYCNHLDETGGALVADSFLEATLVPS